MKPTPADKARASAVATFIEQFARGEKLRYKHGCGTWYPITNLSDLLRYLGEGVEIKCVDDRTLEAEKEWGTSRVATEIVATDASPFIIDRVRQAWINDYNSIASVDRS